MKIYSYLLGINIALTSQTLTAEDDDAAADIYEYDSDADSAAFGGDER